MIIEKEANGIRYLETGAMSETALAEKTSVKTQIAKKPLLIYLHGAGERGEKLSQILVHGPLKEIERLDILQEFIIIAPQCGEGKTWWDYSEKLYQWISAYIKRADVDSQRVYLTGNSMGGFGTWALSMAHAELFAAVLPICGGGLAWNAATLANIPVWAFHCVGDDVVKCQNTIEMVDAVKRFSKTEVKITIYPDISHDAWTQTYQNREVYEWLLSKRKIL